MKNLPQSLLRRVETHVRIMSYPEYFEHSTRDRQHGENVLTVRSPPVTQDGQQQQATTSTPQPRQFSGFTRIHQNYTTSLDNALFYDDVLRKIVPAALGGQSFTVLFCGAPSSGRSQTMYTIDGRRNGGTLTYGMLHHLAAELLEKQNCRVLVSAYHVRGHKIFDSRNDKPVNIRNLHSPLGPTPECTSVLLEKPEDAMIVPNDKRTHGSCFVTFEIYHQLPTGGAGADNADADRKGAFSMITFVDVASFDDPLPPDVTTLHGCISRHVAGSDPKFNECRLSELLESSVCRGRSLIGIATVVGQPASLFHKTCSVLEFVSLLSRIEQVATVCQFVHPRWLPELPAKIKELDDQHEERCKRNYERGVSEVYSALRNAFTAKLQAVEQHMKENSEPAEDLARLRLEMKEKLEQALRQLDSAARDEERRIERNLTEAERLRIQNDKAAAAIQQEGDVLRVKEHDLYLQRSNVEQQQAEVSHELAIHDESRRRHNRTMEELQRGVDSDLAAMREAKKNCLRLQDRIRLHWSQYNYESALAKLTAAKEKAAAQLSEATAKAVIQDQSQRAERQRRTMQFGGMNNNNNMMLGLRSQGSARLGSQQSTGGGGVGTQHQQQTSLARRASGNRRERSEESTRSGAGIKPSNTAAAAAASSRRGSQQPPMHPVPTNSNQHHGGLSPAIDSSPVV